MRILLAILAMLFLAIGLRWLQIFIFTDYRSHFCPIIIPLGVTSCAVGIALLVRLNRAMLAARKDASE